MGKLRSGTSELHDIPFYRVYKSRTHFSHELLAPHINSLYKDCNLILLIQVLAWQLNSSEISSSTNTQNATYITVRDQCVKSVQISKCMQFLISTAMVVCTDHIECKLF